MSCGLDICYCQSNSIIYNILYCFNTSHVTLYLLMSYSLFHSYSVSIHLMLLFIGQKIKKNAFVISFNTSHVTLYLQRQLAELI